MSHDLAIESIGTLAPEERERYVQEIRDLALADPHFAAIFMRIVRQKPVCAMPDRTLLGLLGITAAVAVKPPGIEDDPLF